MNYLKNVERVMFIMWVVMLLLHTTESILCAIADKMILSLVYFVMVIFDAIIIYYCRKMIDEEKN